MVLRGIGEKAALRWFELRQQRKNSLGYMVPKPKTKNTQLIMLEKYSCPVLYYSHPHSACKSSPISNQKQPSQEEVLFFFQMIVLWLIAWTNEMLSWRAHCLQLTDNQGHSNKNFNSRNFLFVNQSKGLEKSALSSIGSSNGSEFRPSTLKGYLSSFAIFEDNC